MKRSQQRTPGIEAPRCEVCGKRMVLARTVPAPAFGPGYEFRTFECPKCHNTQLRSTAPPPPAARAS